MRRPAVATALLALTLLTAGVSSATAEPADPGDPAPSRAEVREARQDARRAAGTVEGIQAQLDAANAQLEATAVAASQAAEAFNGARWRAQQARRAERQAQRASLRADRALTEQRERYRNTVITSFTSGQELSGLEAMLDADGLSALLDRSTAVERVNGAFDAQHEEYLAVSEAAQAAEARKEDAADEAVAAAQEAADARDAAEAAVAQAAAAAEATAAEKGRLLRELARLQGISVGLAEQRQAALEQERLEERREQQQAEDPAPPVEDAPDPTPDPVPTPQPTPAPEPSPEPDPEPSPDPTPDTSPAPDPQGASAAIAFAREQLGEPYRWAAAGPSSWDCSGLTMGAWSAGGKSLPHYSVAQYEQSTPISASQLQPGDLVFWGSSSSPSSIYHVALYTGGGQMIHAPRTGRPVTEESMHYWIPPNFYARP
ncbi:MAG TPA: NlpC/P60 family protein [Nocardioides sp.]|nr:NlpC/P60 family protein [Nocardioides sp.]